MLFIKDSTKKYDIIIIIIIQYKTWHNFQSTQPVSYTHLDVYKRQTQYQSSGWGEEEGRVIRK